MSEQGKQRGVLASSIALLLAIGASPASAFTEQPIIVPQNQAQGEAARQAVPGLPPAQLADPSAAAPKTEGTEVTIPGIGAVGVLPKLDFGLELLYNEQSGPGAAPVAPPTDEGDLQIKGTIKHRF